MSATEHCLRAGPAPSSPRARSGQRGMSIIELMVGLVVALIVGVAASSSAVMFTASQRQGIGVGGVAVNVNTALAAMKNDAATAGLGFFGDSRYLCSSLNLGLGATAHWDGTSFAPVRITRQGGIDRVDVMQASRVESGANVLLALPSTGATASLKSFLPAAVGDAVLLSPEVAGTPCVVRTVTAVAASTVDTPQQLTFAAGGAHNDASFAANPTFSDAGGGVTLLGQLRWNRYRMDGTNLVLERPLDGASAVLARNVIAFRAQYGASSTVPTSRTLETWEDATGTFAALDAAAIARVRAVRVGVVVRSPQPEKPNSSGVCEASLAKPQLFGTEVEPDVPDWRCYRFRSAVLVIPLRNLVLGIRT
ncbi:MAG: putative fimbrial biosis protein PilW [Pseudomonadota bacterium]